jgi:hypothetical protein
VRAIATPHVIEQPAAATQKELDRLVCDGKHAPCVHLLVNLQRYKRGAYQESPVHRDWKAAYPTELDIQRLQDAGAKESYGALLKLLQLVEQIGD